MPRESFGPIWLASLVLAGAVLWPPAASAFSLQCLPRATVFERLEALHGEAPAHAGLASNGALLEVTVAPDGSWTALFTFPDGLTCPIAVGEGWREAPKDEDDDPAA